MRAATAAEISALEKKHRTTDFRVLLEDGGGVFQDLSALGGRNWIRGAEWGATVDEALSSATVTLRREIFGTSISPFIEASPLNQVGGVYAPLVDTRREVRIESETRARGTAVGSLGRRLVFAGDVDVPDTAAGSNVTLACTDPWATLVARQIKEPKEYGSEAGTPLHLVMQQLLDDVLGIGVVTLRVPVAPTFLVKKYPQEAGSLGEALKNLSLLPGWDVRYLWSEPDATYRLTLYQPDRAKSVADRTFAPWEYLKVNRLAIDPTRVRNILRLDYIDAATGKNAYVEIRDLASIAKYGEQFMRLVETRSPIDTEAEALAMANAALQDLRDPFAEMEIELLYFWQAELGDLYTFQANGRHFDTDHTLAVVGYRHRLEGEQRRTVLTLRGRPAGAYGAWLRREVQLAGENAFDPAAVIVSDVEFVEISGAQVWYRPRLGSAVEEAHLHYVLFDGSVPSDWLEKVYGSRVRNIVADREPFGLPQPSAGQFLRAVLIPRAAGPSGVPVIGDGWEIELDGTEPPLELIGTPFRLSSTQERLDLVPTDPRGVISRVVVYETLNGAQTGPHIAVLSSGVYRHTYELHPDHIRYLKVVAERNDGGDPLVKNYEADFNEVPSKPNVRRARVVDQEQLLVDAEDTDAASLWYRPVVGGVAGDEVAIAPRGSDPRFGAFTVTAGAAELRFHIYAKNAAGVAGEYRDVRVEPYVPDADTRYVGVLAQVVASDATTVTVEVTAEPAAASVYLLGVMGSAARLSGPALGVPSPSGTQWIFSRGAINAGSGQALFRGELAAYVSDDDQVTIEEQGRDTVTLQMKAIVVATTSTEQTVRVFVADPYPGGNITITPSVTGSPGVAPDTPQVLAAVSVTADLDTTGYIQFVVQRPSYGSGPGQFSAVASRAGRTQDSDRVDVPEQALPVMREEYSEDGSSATLILTPLTGAVFNQVFFRRRIGNAPWEGWEEDFSSPYQYTVTKTEKHTSALAYRVLRSGVIVQERVIDGIDLDTISQVRSAAATPDGAGTANLRAVFDPDTAVGAGEAQYRVDGGTPISLTVAAGWTATWTVAQSESAEQLVEVQGRNASGTWGPWFPVAIPIYVLTGAVFPRVTSAKATILQQPIVCGGSGDPMTNRVHFTVEDQMSGYTIRVDRYENGEVAATVASGLALTTTQVDDAIPGYISDVNGSESNVSYLVQIIGAGPPVDPHSVWTQTLRQPRTACP